MEANLLVAPTLDEADRALLRDIQAGMAIAADVSRADLLLCTLQADGRVRIDAHAMPHSISSLYRQDATGRTFSGDEMSLALRALQGGSGGRRQREVLRNGAPIIEDVFPVQNAEGRPIAAFVVETTMIAHERQRRRDRYFQQAVNYVLDMCTRGELASAAGLTRFGLYDGIYLVDRSRNVLYMSGIAANMFRTIGLPATLHDQPLNALEPVDIELVDRVFASGLCAEERFEGEDGRTWIRSAVPLRVAVTVWQNRWFTQRVGHMLGFTTERRVEQVLVLLHNATEAVAKQRELNVKSALIQEVHHRVKNNLQNIAAILRMQARRSDSEAMRQELNDAVNRVLSMSVIHEFLSQSDSRSIDVRVICNRIAAQVKEVSRNPEQEIEIRVQGPGIRLPASQATPAAMVINELLLNALEHGMKDRDRGIISITLMDLGDAVRLEVCDDGSGLPEGFQPGASSSLGLQIVRTLVTDDLKGTLTFESGAPAPSGAESSLAGGPAAGPAAAGSAAGSAAGTPGVDARADLGAERSPEGGGLTGTCARVIFPKRPIHVD